MSGNNERLENLLHKLFRLNRPEVDSGRGRVMHTKGAEITRFLDHDLAPQVKQAFASHENDADAIDALAREVDDHLFSFFQRYYSEGEFLAKPLYESGVYDAPDEGQDVSLQWANKDQYYVKSSEYAARDAVDCFIHKDLGAFLRRELDFYITNEVIDLGIIENGTAALTEQCLSKVRVIRRLAGRIIDFLAQLEDLQRNLWLKRRFVVETQYCITLDLIPEALYAGIAANEAQREEWVRLFAIDDLEGDLATPGYTEPLTVEFLKQHPTLVVDTCHLDVETKAALLSSIDDLGAQLGGTLAIGDNFDCLRMFERAHAGNVRMTYIDPPFNTGGDGFAYKDKYFHSSWLTMIDNRVEQALPLLTPDATFYAHIDYTEKERLKLLLERRLAYVTEIIWRIGWLSGYKTTAKKFIRNHDTIYQFAKGDKPFFNKTYIPYPDGYRRRDGAEPTGAGYPLEDTWNCSELDSLNSIQIVSFSREKVGDGSLTQKNENLLERMILSSSEPGDTVLDFFLGSGTTAAVATKMKRRWLGAEANDRMLASAIPRLKRVLHGDRYGVSQKYAWTGSGAFRYLILESYEDALHNLESRRTLESLLEGAAAENADGVGERYRLRYRLDVETGDGESLLNVAAFDDPTAYKLTVRRPGSVESRELNVDLVETFNWLIGLTVQRLAAPQSFSAVFAQDADERLVLERLEQEADGPYWFRAVTGAMPDGRKSLIIWRKLTGEPERDNLVLDGWFEQQGHSTENSEFDLIYVNGDNNLECRKPGQGAWTVRLIEEDFHRQMFDGPET